MKLARILVYTVLVHGSFTAARVVLSLDALHLGASPLTVGIIMSLVAFFPMLASVHTGRTIDRIGPRRPMIAGVALTVAGIALPAIHPALDTLYLVGPVSGLGFLFFHIGVHQAVGQIGPETEHTRNFGLLAIGFSMSSFIGPMLAGFSIDLAGHRAAFALSAAIGLGGLLVLLGDPEPARGAAETAHKGTRQLADLLRYRPLRPVLLVSGLVSMAWDLFTFAVPIYGTRIGLSASQIGVILGAFGGAVFVVRLLIPLISRLASEWQMVIAALIGSAACFATFPLVRSAPVLAALAFATGFAVGATQPMVMALIYRTAPPGRAGEVVGVRSLLINISQTGMPLLTGAFGAALGVAPAFWLMAAMLAAGGWRARRG